MLTDIKVVYDEQSDKYIAYSYEAGMVISGQTPTDAVIDLFVYVHEAKQSRRYAQEQYQRALNSLEAFTPGTVKDQFTRSSGILADTDLHDASYLAQMRQKITDRMDKLCKETEDFIDSGRQIIEEQYLKLPQVDITQIMVEDAVCE